MKKFLNLLRSKILDVKIYIARTMSWVSIANSLMLVFLVVERLSSLGVIKADLSDSMIFVVVVWFGVLVLLGWIEVKKMKIPHAESMKMLELNLPQKEIYEKVRENNERLERIEEKLK